MTREELIKLLMRGAKGPNAMLFRMAFRMGWDAKEIVDQVKAEPECCWSMGDVTASILVLHKDRVADGIK